MKIDLLLSFSVKEKIDNAAKAPLANALLVEDETIELTFAHARDVLWFTNKRIIAMDAQGVTGKRKSFLSIPYSKITSFSIETSGTFDGDNDFKIWLGGLGIFEVKFHKRLDITGVGKYLSQKILS